jgi:putative ABC transport system ATP-binding protein
VTAAVPSAPALRAIGLHKAYRRGREQVHALRGASIEVAPGELVALLGRSGSGKTTLLNCLLGWERQDEGEVAVPGAPVPAAAPWTTVAVVPQQFGLVEELTLADNVALPAGLAGLADPRGAATATLVALRLEHLADRRPEEVSLGEQQRTAIARAVVVRPRFLVADEPTGRLDEELTLHVLSAIRALCAAAGTGVLVASHDPAVVAAADRVVRLNDGAVTSHTT